MGRLIRLLPLSLILILLLGMPARAENWLQVKPEQVRITLPEVKLWLYPENDQGEIYDAFQPDDVRAFLDERPLGDPSLTPYAETGAGSTYFFLFDVSGSIPGETFAAIKQGLAAWKQTLLPQDKLVLITLGEQATLVLDGSESAIAATERIAAIQNSEKHTRLYDSFEKAI